MADFESALKKTLRFEGGYSNDPSDPGGETKFGVSKRSYPNLDIASLTIADAAAIYRKDYWTYDSVQSQAVAEKVFDMAVNMGPNEAHSLLQRSLNYFGKKLTEDGKFGPSTLAAVNTVDSEKLLAELRARWAFRVAKLIQKRPVMTKFALGWCRRAMA